MQSWIGTVTLAAMMFGGWGWAGANETSQTPQPVRLEVDLLDGSRVVGDPGLEKVSLQTSYAKMSLPWKLILAITPADERETAVVDLRNGDRLKGVIGLDAIELATVFGKVRIGYEHIAKVRAMSSIRGLSDVLTRGLILRCSFDDDRDGQVFDESGRKNNGKVYGATWTAKGKIGGAYDFDGKDDLIEMGPSRLYKTTGQFSACAWVYLRGDVAILLSNYHGGSAYSGQFFFACKTPNSEGWRTLDVVLGQGPGVYLRYMSSKRRMQQNVWSHVAFSYDEARGPGKKVRLYLDGEEMGDYEIQSEGNGGPILNIEEGLRIMAHRDTPTGTLSNGMLDEVMVFDRALSDTEIREIYDAQK